MVRTRRQPKSETFNFRIDPALKTAFTAAAEAEKKRAAQILRDFMRVYVKRRHDKAFEAEAKRQSLAIAERSRDPHSDDYASLGVLDALFDADHFASRETA